MRVCIVDIACWCLCSILLSFVTSKFFSNTLMRFGLSVALASCWVEPILLLLLLLLLLILQVIQYVVAFCLVFCSAA